MSVLVVAAHPDDEVLGCGGTVARLAGAGEQVHIAILGEGATSRAGAPAGATGALAAQAQEAGRALGAAEVVCLGLPDNRFDTLALLDVVQAVERLVARVAPHTVYTHHAGDLNVDHRIAHQAVVTATRPLPGAAVRRVLAFEVFSATEWGFGGTGPAFAPVHFVDVTETLEAKQRALACYAGELRPFPHPRSPEAVEALATWRGATAGLMRAEAFEVVRWLE
jgi:LmbE family N-acetylglucosaminyl deacetylase